MNRAPSYNGIIQIFKEITKKMHEIKTHTLRVREEDSFMKPRRLLYVRARILFLIDKCRILFIAVSFFTQGICLNICLP